MRLIVTVIGKGMHVLVVGLPPEEAQSHFGPLAMLVGVDKRPLGLIQDLEQTL